MPAHGQYLGHAPQKFLNGLHVQISDCHIQKSSFYRQLTGYLTEPTGFQDEPSGFQAELAGFHTELTGSRVQQRQFSRSMVKYNTGANIEQSDTVPNPSAVLRKSMLIPGWGQVVNKQVWKVPVIYGLFAGLTYYSIVTDQSYRDYRAAYYNSQNPDGDERFGPTPGYIDPNQNPESIRYSRNMFRNHRDLTFIGIGLVYGLNIIDAYVFAHLRDFDVSDDLSARINIGPPPVSENISILAIDRFPENNFSGIHEISVTLTLNIH